MSTGIHAILQWGKNCHWQYIQQTASVALGCTAWSSLHCLKELTNWRMDACWIISSEQVEVLISMSTLISDIDNRNAFTLASRGIVSEEGAEMDGAILKTIFVL